jgi:ATP-dependent helicase/nuclease subunit B
VVTAVDLVPHERQAELAQLSGRRAFAWRRVIADLAARASDRAPATSETTRLACARALGRPGQYAAAFDQGLGSLRRAGARPAELARLTLPRARQFATVLAAVDAELDRAGLRDERGDAWLAAEAAARGELGALGGNAGLHLRGFCRFDAGELALIEALHEQLVQQGGSGVTLELPSLELAKTFGAMDRVARELEARWADDAQHPALEHRDSRGALEVELVPAQDDASEARAVARSILDALAAGIALDRLAIAPAELSESFLEPLRRELEAAGIPYFEPRARPLRSAPHAHAALELIELASGALDRDALVDILRTPGLDATRWLGEGLEREEWASELQSLPIRVDRSGGELLNELTLRAADLEREGSDAQRTRLALAATQRCLQDLTQNRQARSRATQRSSWLGLLGELGLMGPSPQVLAQALERRAAGRRELLSAVADNGLAVRALGAAFERTTQAAAALGLADEPVELADYLAELELSAASVNPTRGGRRGGALWIARPEELSGLELEVVVLCRASSSRLEGGSAVDCGELLGEELVSALPDRSGRRRPQASALSANQGGLAAAWILGSARRTVVTYALRDARGPLTPSPLVRALQRGREARATEPASPLHPRARRVSPFGAASADAARRARTDAERQAYFLDPHAAAGALTGASGDIAALVGGSKERPLAITALETYARCPFLAFASYVLRAVRDEAPGDGIGIRERGSLIHGALAAAHEAMKPLWGRRTPAELEQVALAAAGAYLERRGQGALRRAGLSAAFFDVAAAVRWSLNEGAELPFAEAERGFGRGQGWAAFELGEYWLSGRIDRIDHQRGSARARVIDYKTGKPPSLKKLGDELLQPWLYGLKVAAELGVTDVQSGYLALGDRTPRLTPSVAVSLEEEGALAALQRARRSLELFGQGAIEPRPRQARSCTRCDGRDLCRRPLSAPLPNEDDES